MSHLSQRRRSLRRCACLLAGSALAALLLSLPTRAQPAQQVVIRGAVEIGDNLGGLAVGDVAAKDNFGIACCSLGDLNNDGVTDIAVGVRKDDDHVPVPGPNQPTNRGAVWILFLNADGTVKAKQKISATQGNFTGDLSSSEEFGRALCNLGDLDGDGVVDLAVGVGKDTHATPDVGQRGSLYVLFLNTDGTVKSHVKIGQGEGGFLGNLLPGDGFGKSITTTGDLSGDGVVDLAVGAPASDYGGDGKGAVWLLRMNADGTVQNQKRLAEGFGLPPNVLDEGDLFGSSVAYLGLMDLNPADPTHGALPTLAVGASQDDDGQAQNGDLGAVYLLNLTVPGGNVVARKKISAFTPGFQLMLTDRDRFGYSMASVGDWDGNGVDDLAVGALFDDDGWADRGAVWIVMLEPDGSVRDHLKISNTPNGFPGVLGTNSANGEQGDNFGTSVAALGDFDGDGNPDLLAGAELADGINAQGQPRGTDQNAGSVWVIRTGRFRLLPKERVDGAIHLKDDHVFPFQAAAGTKVVFKAVRLGGGMKPALVLYDRDGSVLLGVDDTQKSKKSAVVKHTIEHTGTYAIEVVNVAGFPGEYRLRSQAKPPPKVKAIVAVGAEEQADPVPLESVEGTVLKKLSLKALKPKGDYAVIGEAPAALLPWLDALMDPEGGSLPVDELLSVNKTGTAVTLKNVDLSDLGSYSAHVGGVEDSVGYARVLGTLKFPKGKTKYVVP